jgi:predicted AlkP superfamily pyrophosphatase or phosphodiesterase
MPKPTLALCFFFAATSLLAQAHQPVLLISVDGLRPDYVTQADKHHLRIPNLRQMLAHGTHGDGVVGVFPTVSYPSHTTLVTGVGLRSTAF